MVKRSICLFLVFALLSGCGKSDPPTSGGKTASYWIDMLKQSDVKLRRKAVTKLGPLALMDTGAIPALIGALKRYGH